MYVPTQYEVGKKNIKLKATVDFNYGTFVDGQ